MKLLFLITEDEYFFLHRKPIALAALKAGWDVHLVTQISSYREQIEQTGIKVHPLSLRKGSLNPFFDLIYIVRVIKLYYRIRPDIVHHVAMKPVLYGSIAAIFFKRLAIVNAIGGTGFLLNSKKFHLIFIKKIVFFCFYVFLNQKKSVFITQNNSDKIIYSKFGIAFENIFLIPGSGVELNVFIPPLRRTSNQKIKVIMVSRLLYDKGVVEYFSAARILHERGFRIHCMLAGKRDAQNPNTLSKKYIDIIKDSGYIELLGFRSDIYLLYREADIAVLPSYHEGLSKSLIEAASCGLPIVTTDIPGCREVVEHDVNGLLVPPRDVVALADAIERLALDADLRERMGHQSRMKAEREFGVESTILQTMNIYNALLLHK